MLAGLRKPTNEVIEDQTDFELLLLTLGTKRLDDNKMYFSYQLDEEGAYKGMKNIELAHVTGLFFQLPSMHTNYERYHELVFVDCSIK